MIAIETFNLTIIALLLCMAHSTMCLMKIKNETIYILSYPLKILTFVQKKYLKLQHIDKMAFQLYYTIDNCQKSS